MTLRTDNIDFRMLNSPIKWAGGKSRLRQPIIALLPTHTCYVEVFGGAAWVLEFMHNKSLNSSGTFGSIVRSLPPHEGGQVLRLPGL
jgi:site-specific DNA-adenine methylase